MSRNAWLLAAAFAATFAAALLARFSPSVMPPLALPDPAPRAAAVREAGMVLVPAGTFHRGAASGPADAQPAGEVYLDAFWIDEHEVTNAQFAAFVEATGYVTAAERRGRSRVFLPREKRWEMVAGANWRHPAGPEDTIVGREQFPAVHLSWHDADRYAAWAGKQLPTEAQWERAARAGRLDADFPWGAQPPGTDFTPANLWQGRFPFVDHGQDGFAGLAPVGRFPPNDLGLWDMAGNVAEWCADWYAEDAYLGAAPRNPRGPAQGVRRVVRGGSWITPQDFTGGYRVWARDSLPPEETNNHTGMRCVRPANSPSPPG